MDLKVLTGKGYETQPPLASSENLFTLFLLRFVQEVELIEESLVDGCPDPHVKLEDEGDRVRKHVGRWWWLAE